MEQLCKPARYNAAEINEYMDDLRSEYDIVRLVDAEECRIVEAEPTGGVRYLNECFRIWGRGARCSNCTSYRACRTHCAENKSEYLGEDREDIRSVPAELVLPGGETQTFVIECVRFSKKDGDGARLAAEKERENVRSLDPLTQLYNAEKLYRKIRKRLNEEPGRYLLLMCNIRNFSLFNKLFGAESGNRMLVGAADFLREQNTDGMICGRYRDDRFLVFVPERDFDAEDFAVRFRDRVRNFGASRIFELYVKVGVYEITDVNMPIAVMADHVELAVDGARDDMDVTVCRFDDSLLEDRLRDQRVLTHFEKSMAKNEYNIYLQPQVREDGSITGAEALVRWVRPEGVVPPSEFLPVLARTELLSHLDLHVWEQVASLLGKWRGTELEKLSISVNVDPSDFLRLDVPAELSRLCKKYGVDPASLRVEITEAALAADIERESSVTERLHEAGFSVEIDDFGKGSSSLSLLKDVHADTLKIDMGFLHGRENRARSRIIIRSVIEMAKNLGMDVITEGVETKDQVEALAEIGCRRFQGYYFSKPVPVFEFEELMRGK